MDKIYQINESSLTKIADAIRDNYGFTDKLTLEDMPKYLQGQNNMFWVTHFNEFGEGTGSIVTRDPSSFNSFDWAWRLWFALKPVQGSP
jgi:hypothetical protein